MAHSFGGIWTQRKLEVLERYLDFYVKALKNQNFTLHYVDAFAGTGTHNPIEDGDQTTLLPIENLRGSVLTALGVEPGFDCYHFNDLNPEHVNELQKIKAEYSHKNIQLYEKDANLFVPEFCNGLSWNDRAVLFLDPYSTELDWQTLKCIAKSQKVDLWLLFPLSVIIRMTPKDGAKIRPEWKKTIDRLLGTSEWVQALYKPVIRPPMDDLFNSDTAHSNERINITELEKWITSRLGEEFAWVSDPLQLTNNNKPLFLFYFAVSNNNQRAVSLAKKVCKQIVNKFKANGR